MAAARSMQKLESEGAKKWEAISPQRYAAHDKEGTHSGQSRSRWFAGNESEQLYLTQLGVLWLTWVLLREDTLFKSACLTQQQHSDNEGEGRTKTK